MQVLLRGGQVTKEVDARTTHLVVLPPPEAGDCFCSAGTLHHAA